MYNHLIILKCIKKKVVKVPSTAMEMCIRDRYYSRLNPTAVSNTTIIKYCILYIVYLYEIFNVKTDVDLLHPLKHMCRLQAIKL